MAPPSNKDFRPAGDGLISAFATQLGDAARLVSGRPEDLAVYDSRLETNLAAKLAIADTVVRIIDRSFPKSSGPLLLDTGTVTYCIAARDRGPIITPNEAISLLARREGWGNLVDVTPGPVDEETQAHYGLQTDEYVRVLIEICRCSVLGMRAFDMTRGLAEDHLVHRNLQSIILADARPLIVVAQGEKLLKKDIKYPLTPSSVLLERLHERACAGAATFVYHAPTRPLSAEELAMYRSKLDRLIEIFDGNVREAKS